MVFTIESVNVNSFEIKSNITVVYVSDKYAHLIMRRSDSERRIITDPGGVSGGTFDLLALILTLMNRQKQRSSPRVSFFDRVLTDQREKKCCGCCRMAA